MTKTLRLFLEKLSLRARDGLARFRGRLARLRGGEDPYTRLRADAEAAVTRLQAGALRPADLIAAEAARLDGSPEWTECTLRSGTLHDPDFAVFGRVDPSWGTILDVGANSGYSVSSIRNAGCASPILSFEVLAGYRPCLQRLKTLLGGSYDYILSGVGAAPERLVFYTPVINGQALTALTTAHAASFSALGIDHMIEYARKAMPGATSFRFHFLKQEAEVDALDRLLGRAQVDVPLDRIAAIKLDVEGHEGATLAGARQICERDRPLLMIESGNWCPRVRAFTEALGYQTAQAVEGAEQIRVHEGHHSRVNGFFFHPSHEARYRDAGLLAGAPA